jgi:hypothetical protein
LVHARTATFEWEHTQSKVMPFGSDSEQIDNTPWRNREGRLGNYSAQVRRLGDGGVLPLYEVDFQRLVLADSARIIDVGVWRHFGEASAAEPSGASLAITQRV